MKVDLIRAQNDHPFPVYSYMGEVQSCMGSYNLQLQVHYELLMQSNQIDHACHNCV